MGFRNPVGPVNVTTTSGIRYDPVTGELILYTTPTGTIRVDAGTLDVSDGLVAGGPVIGRAGVSVGGVDPDGGHALHPVTGGLFNGVTAAGGTITANHGGWTTPNSVVWLLAAGTVFNAPGFTIIHQGRSATTITAKVYDDGGTVLGAGLAVVAFFLCVFPD